MSPFTRQPTIFLRSPLTEEFPSEPFWIDGAISSAFREVTLDSPEGSTTSLDGSTDHLLPLFEDDCFGQLTAPSGHSERVNCVDSTMDWYSVPSDVQLGDLYVTFSLSLSPLIILTGHAPIHHHVVSSQRINSFTINYSAANTMLYKLK